MRYQTCLNDYSPSTPIFPRKEKQMPNTRQAYVELNFKETSRSGECNLREWNESEAVLKDVKLEGDTISYTLCAGRDTTADRITMSASISGSPGFKFAVFRALEAKLNARLKAHRPIVWHADSSDGATFVIHESVTVGGSTYGALALGGKL
jgi:hypothetical protein